MKLLTRPRSLSLEPKTLGARRNAALIWDDKGAPFPYYNISNLSQTASPATMSSFKALANLLN